MKIITNTPLVEQRTKWAKRIAPLTMLFLLGGLVTNFLSISRPQFFQPMLILLGLGFISAIFSSSLVNTWVREPRADQVLSQLLKKFNNDYILFNYNVPIPHTLVAPDGIYAIVVKAHDGQIKVNGRQFKRKFTWQRLFRFMADEGLGSPISEAENRVKKLDKFLRQSLSDAEIPAIKPLVLFSNKNLDLTVTDPPIPVLSTADFKSFLRDQSKNRTVKSGQRKSLISIFDPQP